MRKFLFVIYRYIEFIAALIVFFVYYQTFGRYIMEIDWGEFVCCLYYLGIPHPTGYPLFTLIGWLFLKLPFGMSVGAQANLLSSIYSTIGIFFFVKILKELSYRFYFKEYSDKDLKLYFNLEANLQKNIKRQIIFILSCGLSLAFISLYWKQAVAIEVYSLQMALQNAAIYFCLKAYFEATNKDYKYWILTSIFVGLCFSNHLMTIYLIPGFAFLFFEKNKLTIKSWIKASLLICLASLIACSFYVFMYFRANQEPLFNWGNPSNWDSLIAHIAGRQYSGYVFSGITPFFKNLYILTESFFVEYLFIGAVVVFIGIKELKLLNKKLFLWLLITLLWSIFISCNYNIGDIDNYFLTIFVLSFVIFYFGFNHFRHLFEKKLRVEYLAIIVVILILALNYQKNDFSNYEILKNFSAALDETIEDNSIVLVEKADQFFCGYYYDKFIEQKYQSKHFVSLTLMWLPWYYDQITRLYPEFFAGLEKESKLTKNKIRDYYKKKVELDTAAYYLTLLRSSLIAKFLSEGKNVYLNKETFTLLDNKTLFIPQGYSLAPTNFLYKVAPDSAYVKIDYDKFFWKFDRKSLNGEKYLNQILPFVVADRIAYELNFKNYDKAVELYDNLKESFPYFPINKDIQTFIARYKMDRARQ